MGVARLLSLLAPESGFIRCSRIRSPTQEGMTSRFSTPIRLPPYLVFCSEVYLRYDWRRCTRWACENSKMVLPCKEPHTKTQERRGLTLHFPHTSSPGPLLAHELALLPIMIALATIIVSRVEAAGVNFAVLELVKLVSTDFSVG